MFNKILLTSNDKKYKENSEENMHVDIGLKGAHVHEY